MVSGKPVLVTGAGGYLASWVVKMLLEAGHTVNGTVRSKADSKKIAHLLKLQEQYPGKLSLFEADLLQEGSFAEAMTDCETVYHMASPFQFAVGDAQKDLVEPALNGTKNVLHEVNKHNSVKRVVLTSSVAALYSGSTDLDKDTTFSEEDWNTRSSLTHTPYFYSKTLAEQEAWNLNKAQDRWTLAVINPSFISGPSLSDRIDGESTKFMVHLCNGNDVGVDMYGFVDVRDVAAAHVKAGTQPTVKGRFILSESTYTTSDISNLLRKEVGDKGFSYPTIPAYDGHQLLFTNKKSKEELGVEYRPFSTTLRDMVEQLILSGLVTAPSK